MNNPRRFTVGRVLALLGVLALCLLLAQVFYWRGEYLERRDDLSGALHRQDQLAARGGLERIKYFKQLTAKLRPWRLEGLATRYLFDGLADLRYYEAAYDYLTGRFDRVKEELKDDPGFWGHYLRANAQWRQAQGVFAQTQHTESASAEEMRKLADQLAENTKDDYETAVKITGARHLPSSWNYDLTTNAQARAAALQPKPAQIKVRLGLGGKNNKGRGLDKGQGSKGSNPQDLKIGGPIQESSPKLSPRRPG